MGTQLYVLSAVDYATLFSGGANWYHPEFGQQRRGDDRTAYLFLRDPETQLWTCFSVEDKTRQELQKLKDQAWRYSGLGSGYCVMYLTDEMMQQIQHRSLATDAELQQRICNALSI